MLALRNPLESGLKAISPHAVNFSEAAGRLPNTTLFAVEGMKAETAVIAFGLEGIAVSSGAACSSGKVQPSHVLAATEICARARRGALCRGRYLNDCIGERFTTVRMVKRPTWGDRQRTSPSRNPCTPRAPRWIFWRRPLVKAQEFFT